MRKVAALMVEVGATVMAVSLVVLNCHLTFAGFAAKLTKDQLDHLISFSVRSILLWCLGRLLSTELQPGSNLM